MNVSPLFYEAQVRGMRLAGYVVHWRSRPWMSHANRSISRPPRNALRISNNSPQKSVIPHGLSLKRCVTLNVAPLTRLAQLPPPPAAVGPIGKTDRSSV